MNKDYATFRPFRFPSCPDRLVYWAPKALHRRMSWVNPRKTYEVNHLQGGSDHRPVWFEAVLTLSPPAAKENEESRSVAAADLPNRLQSLLASDAGDSIDEDDGADAFAPSNSEATDAPSSPRSSPLSLNSPSRLLGRMDGSMFSAVRSISNNVSNTAATTARKAGETAASSASSAASSAQQMGESAIRKVSSVKTGLQGR